MLLGAVPAAAGVVVAHGRGTGVLGLLLVLPGLLAALVFTLVLAQDVTAAASRGRLRDRASQGSLGAVLRGRGPAAAVLPRGQGRLAPGPMAVALILLDAAVFMVTAATAPGPFLPPDEATPHVLGTMPGPLATT